MSSFVIEQKLRTFLLTLAGLMCTSSPQIGNYFEETVCNIHRKNRK